MPAFSSRLKNRVTAFALIALHVINVAALTHLPFMHYGKGILDSYLLFFTQSRGPQLSVFFVLWLVPTLLCACLLKLHAFRASLLKFTLIALIMAFGPAGASLLAAVFSGDPECLLQAPWAYWHLFSTVWASL